jgi:hypothetical protein
VAPREIDTGTFGRQDKPDAAAVTPGQEGECGVIERDIDGRVKGCGHKAIDGKDSHRSASEFHAATGPKGSARRTKQPLKGAVRAAERRSRRKLAAPVRVNRRLLSDTDKICRARVPAARTPGPPYQRRTLLDPERPEPSHGSLQNGRCRPGRKPSVLGRQYRRVEWPRLRKLLGRRRGAPRREASVPRAATGGVSRSELLATSKDQHGEQQDTSDAWEKH